MLDVMVVDDDQDMVEVFCEWLRIKEVNVVGTCKNGFEAAKMYSELKPDMVLLDVMMPEYDGFYALEKIREQDPNAKVVMVTADLTADTEKKLIDMKASAITYKPYEIDQIIDVIDRVNKGENVLLSPATKEIEA